MTIPELRTKLAKSLDFLKSELSQIRTGRATPSLIENISVEAYGTSMTLRELSSITVVDSQTLAISPWDKSMLNDILKPVRESDLKVNPVIDGDHIIVPIPALTEERRKDFVKLVSAKMEDFKASIRNIRQDAMRDIEKSFTDKLIGEDDKFAQKEEVETVVKELVSKAEEICEMKKQELMRI